MQQPFEAEESPYAMRVGEGGQWQLDTTKFGGSPSNPTATVTNAAGQDVTSSLMPGSCTVFGNLIFLPTFLSTLAGRFWVTVQFTNNSWNPARPFIRVDVSDLL